MIVQNQHELCSFEFKNKFDSKKSDLRRIYNWLEAIDFKIEFNSLTRSEAYIQKPD